MPANVFDVGAHNVSTYFEFDITQDEFASVVEARVMIAGQPESTAINYTIFTQSHVYTVQETTL